MKKKLKITRLPLESLACVNPDHQDYGLANAENLYVRKIYGKDHICYLRCRTCQEEFSERKNTAFWNVNIREKKAVSVAELLSESNSIKGTSHLVRVDLSSVRRLNEKIGQLGFVEFVVEHFFERDTAFMHKCISPLPYRINLLIKRFSVRLIRIMLMTELLCLSCAHCHEAQLFQIQKLPITSFLV